MFHQLVQGSEEEKTDQVGFRDFNCCGTIPHCLFSLSQNVSPAGPWCLGLGWYYTLHYPLGNHKTSAVK